MKRVFVFATPVKGKELEPGDLFSTAGNEYWKRIDADISIGERAYIRTNASASYASDAEEIVHRLKIVTVDMDAVYEAVRRAVPRKGEDVHEHTARIVFGDVNDDTRERAKMLNHLLAYSGGRDVQH